MAGAKCDIEQDVLKVNAGFVTSNYNLVGCVVRCLFLCVSRQLKAELEVKQGQKGWTYGCKRYFACHNNQHADLTPHTIGVRAYKKKKNWNTRVCLVPVHFPCTQITVLYIDYGRCTRRGIVVVSAISQDDSKGATSLSCLTLHKSPNGCKCVAWDYLSQVGCIVLLLC